MRTRLALTLSFVSMAATGASSGWAQSSPPPARSSVPAPGTRLLAETQGKQGLIRVEERGDLRVLTIGGVVQGAKRLADKAGGTATYDLAGDPAVALARAASPKARRALVLGLGTGQTAAELAARGLEVEAVELEPAVIDYARKYFGYGGHAESIDGLAALQRRRKYDLVLVDASTNKTPPASLTDHEAQALIHSAIGPTGAVVYRMLAAPASEEVERVQDADGGFHLLFGSGVGEEEQNLYLLWSDSPLEVLAPKGSPLRLLRAGNRGNRTFDAAGVFCENGAPDCGRRVLLAGYLVRLAETQELALELPHWEMGGVRFLLTGKPAEALASKAPRPRDIVIGDEVDEAGLRPTLYDLAGGGGCKRSEVRFSPVVVVVEGTVRFRAVVDPDRVVGGKLIEWDPTTGRPQFNKTPAHEPRLPYGGILYDLEVSRVVMTYDRASWERFSLRQKPAVAGVVRALAGGNLAPAEKGLTAHMAALDAELGAAAGSFLYASEMKRLTLAIRAELAEEHSADPVSLASRCNRPLEKLGDYPTSRDAIAMSEALRKCAIRWYERAVANEGSIETARPAAARLLQLYVADTYGENVSNRRRADRRKRIERLERRFGPEL